MSKVKRALSAPAPPTLERLFPIQRVGMIPWSVAERAYERYAQLHGRSQSLERMAERGGFGLAELGFLLRGYGRRNDSKEDDRDWQFACEHATMEILKALADVARLQTPQRVALPLGDSSSAYTLRYSEDKAFFTAGVIAARRDSDGLETDNDLIDYLWQGYAFT